MLEGFPVSGQRVGGGDEPTQVGPGDQVVLGQTVLEFALKDND